MEFAGERFVEVENRLNEVNDLKGKYGRTIEDVLHALEEKTNRIKQLKDYDTYLFNLEKELNEAKKKVENLSSQLSVLRQ